MKIAITMGDPAGVGPEVCLKLLASDLPANTRPTIIGSRAVLALAAEICGLAMPADDQIVDMGSLDFVPSKVSASCGTAAYSYITHAIDGALAGDYHAVVTAPINKESLHAAGIPFPGHTEIFTDRTGSKQSCMMQYSDEVTATFVTCHCGYADVPKFMTTERILEVIRLSNDALTRIKNRPPELVALGLNPHAGENGLFGNREEENIIIPALEAAKAEGIRITGPIPPDTAFIPSKRRSTDCFICMYHDQGHIPLKALAFDSAVNVTLGLPIIRTSVDHGTAFDIAWQGIANPGSIRAAYSLATQLSAQSN
jgi:4-hydroxythreonine-4-phosphate dehydrogenase